MTSDAEIWRTAMVRTRQPSQSAFRSILTRYGDPKTRDDVGVLYVGLGDKFDDDRRLVRAGEGLPDDMRRTTLAYMPRVAAGERQGMSRSDGDF